MSGSKICLQPTHSTCTRRDGSGLRAALAKNGRTAAYRHRIGLAGPRLTDTVGTYGTRPHRKNGSRPLPAAPARTGIDRERGSVAAMEMAEWMIDNPRSGDARYRH